MTTKKGCDCGCKPADCCELDCLVHPRFFCGQLLADQDLTALVDWIKAKSALSRYRDGWGVVCGLDVHCGKHGSVTVSPGYALDCCGRDIVICKELPFEWKDCWQRGDDPCAAGDVQRRQGAAANNGPKLKFNGLEVDADKVQAFDLYIRYAETLADARTALAKGGCGGVAGCEYTRVHEGGELYCKPANDCDDPNERIVSDWVAKYVAELEQIFADLLSIGGAGGTQRLKRLLAYVHEHPLHSFCFVHEWLCQLDREQREPTDDEFNDAAFWIVQDWRNEFLRIGCKSCSPETGVLLARVWVMKQNVRNQEVFTTLDVSPYEPFRRVLAKDDYPIDPASINVGPFIWHPYSGVHAALRDAGFQSIGETELTFSNLVELRRKLGLDAPRAGLFLDFNRSSVTALYKKDHCDRHRVVAFTQINPFTDNPTPVVPQTGRRTQPPRARGRR